jgi:hypothetical protein
MMRDKLSKREDRVLHQALASVVLTRFPNPQRKDCPGPSVLRAIATKSIPMRDPVHDHVGSCSPCFSELTEMRQALYRRNLMWAMGTAGAAVLVLVVFVGYFGFFRVDNPVGQELGQPGTPTETPQRVDSIPTPQASQTEYERALLDLRNASPTRTVQPSGSTSNVQPIEIRRGLLALTVQLPVGSEAGSYDVEIRKPNQAPTRTAKAQATIENGITTLPINMDTNSIQPGEYEFAWRLADFSWRHYPILIR